MVEDDGGTGDVDEVRWERGGEKGSGEHGKREREWG
jgi:hypothetical protein